MLLAVLNFCKDEEVVLHFRCPHCGEDQVTETETAEDIASSLKEKDIVILGYDCSDCDARITSINDTDIVSVEPL